MKRFTPVILSFAVAITFASNTFAGTIVGARTSRTGTIVGARTGNIVGARTGNITGARTGNISGTSVAGNVDRTRSGFESLLNGSFLDIFHLLLENPLF